MSNIEGQLLVRSIQLSPTRPEFCGPSSRPPMTSAIESAAKQKALPRACSGRGVDLWSSVRTDRKFSSLWNVHRLSWSAQRNGILIVAYVHCIKFRFITTNEFRQIVQYLNPVRVTWQYSSLTYQFLQVVPKITHLGSVFWQLHYAKINSITYMCYCPCQCVVHSS